MNEDQSMGRAGKAPVHVGRVGVGGGGWMVLHNCNMCLKGTG